MNSVKTSLRIFLLLIFFLGCNGESQLSSTAKPQAQHPAWSLSPVAKRKLVTIATKLKTGDAYAAVIAALGKPDRDEQETPKGGSVSHGRLLYYRLSTWEAGLSNTFHDESIYVDLDTSNVVREIRIQVTLTN